MMPRTFTGATSREVLRKVRAALGDDAVIVSNVSVAGGIEITALAGDDMPGAERSVTAALPAPAGDGMVQHMMREMASMKALMQRELSSMAWSGMKERSPARAAMMQMLLDSGFSPALMRELVGAVQEDATAAVARKLVTAEIQRRLPVTTHEALVEQGGVFALIGPTGVGKTTTVAKLAARCVVRHGANSLALLTTDSYRIAAHDQLRIYGRILNVPVHAVKDGDDLKSTLLQLRDKRAVLIDTVGMSQRDKMVAEQAAMLGAGNGQIRRLLLLNASTNAATLDEVIRNYSGGGIHGCIITKIDESASVGAALDSAIRHKLRVHYVTNGQRVPEDVHVPNATYLTERALRVNTDAAVHTLRPEEYPFAMGAGVAHA
ncbi:MAG: flagellar biosynthesis protein FlhF [Betaproteobacteria bacterium]